VRLLLVEDDIVIASELARLLEKEKFSVDVAAEGDTGLRFALENTYDLLILDVMLPHRSGWDICKAVRDARIQTPILMLTARDAVEDRVKGLEGGADDYLIKPFDFRELRARIRLLLRRDMANRQETMTFGDLTIDSKARTVRRGGHEIHLTRREFQLLEALARNAGRTLTRAVILERVWDEEESQEASVNFHVTSLRKKVDAPYDEKVIHTVHGVGYVFRYGAES
jgi:two-component system copper resistance phosphate regulon response regulator CusR